MQNTLTYPLPELGKQLYIKLTATLISFFVYLNMK